MTVPHYGRVTPIQSLVLGLGGEIIHVLVNQAPDEQRISKMKSSRELLCRLTGHDFGYDLAAWHHFLINSEAHSEQYTFPYAWKAVQRKILELIADPNRLRLVQLLDSAAGTTEGASE
jgi:hypothetical protein